MKALGRDLGSSNSVVAAFVAVVRAGRSAHRALTWASASSPLQVLRLAKGASKSFKVRRSGEGALGA